MAGSGRRSTEDRNAMMKAWVFADGMYLGLATDTTGMKARGGYYYKALGGTGGCLGRTMLAFLACRCGQLLEGMGKGVAVFSNRW